MKKLNIIIGSTIFMLLIIAIVILFSKESPNIKLTTFEKSYNYVSAYNEKEKFSIEIYVDQTDSYITNINLINNCYLSDENEEDLLKIKIEEIQLVNKGVKLNSNVYNLYKFIFEIDLITESSFSFLVEKAYLKINYLDKDSLFINIGSFSFYKVPYIGSINDYISLSRLRGIVKEVDGLKTISGLDLEITNNTNKEITIDSIEMLDLNLSIYNDDCRDISGMVLEVNSNISDILGYDYTKKHSFKTKLDIKISPNNTLNYLFPLLYENNNIVNKCGFIVNYLVDEKLYSYFFDEFIFFQNNIYSEKEIRNLKYYIYENN